MMFSTRKRTDRLVTFTLATLAATVGAGAWFAFQPLSRPPAPPAPAPAASVPAPAPDLSPSADIAVAPPKVAAPPAAESLPFKLHGVIYSTSGASVIFLQAGSDSRIGRVGDAFDGWKLTRIDKDRATFTREDRDLTLVMENVRYEGGPMLATVAAATVQSPGSARPAGTPGNSREKMLTVSRTTAAAPRPKAPAGVDATVAVARQDAERMRQVAEKALKEDPASVLQGAIQGIKVEPCLKQGQMEGLLLRSVPVGSLAAQYSLAPGDRILAVNGQPLDSFSRAMELYRTMGNTDSVTVTLEREGKRREVMFYIQ